MNQHSQKVPGTIIFIAPFYNRSGFAVGARATVTALHHAGISLRIISVNEVESGIDDCDLDLLKKLEKTPVTPPITTIIFHVPSREWLKFKFPEPNLRILATAFDCSNPENLPSKEWLDIFAEMDQIWVQSRKEQEAFIAAGLPPEKVEFICWPHHWKENHFLPPVKLENTTPDKPFRFFSVAMFQPRRRWNSLIEAYLKEFKHKENIELYLKVSYPSWHPIPGQPELDLQNLITSLRLKTHSDASIVVDCKLGTRKELLELFDNCHAYVSTDTSPTAPVAEARARKRLVITSCGIHSLEDGVTHIRIKVDPEAKIPVTEEMSRYKHYHKGELMPQLHPIDVQHALRKAFSLPPRERHQICQNSIRDVPGPRDTIPKIIDAINNGWQHKKTLQNYNLFPEKTAIVWEGAFFVHHSLSLVNREMIHSLVDNSDYAIKLLPYEKEQFKPDADHYLNKLVPLINSDVGKADIHVRHHWPPNLEPPNSGHWVIIQPWEFGSLPKEWVEKFQAEVDECWVPSHYVKQVYVESGVDEKRVFVIPNGINPSVFHPQVPPTPLKTKKGFKFLFVGGTIHRKGIDILLKIYSKTFTNEDDVTLIIKDFGGDAFYQGQTIAEYIKRLQADKNAPEIIYINQTLPENELVGLYTACDVLVHPYRGEGFGLPILEAMACGTPVIVTNGGAALDFCKPYCSLLINSKKVVQSYNHVGDRELVDNAWFFEPEPADLAAKMLYAYKHQKEMKEKGWQAHKETHRHWKWEDSGKKICERILELKDKPLQRDLDRKNLEQKPNLQNLPIESELETLKKILLKTPGDIDTLKKLTELYIKKGRTYDKK